MSSIVKFEHYIDVCTELFMERMGEYAQAQQPVDLATWIQWYAFDVIGELYFSSMFGFMRRRCDIRDYIASLDTLLPALCTASVMPAYARAPFLASGLLLSSVRKALKALKNIEEASETCVRERLQSRPNEDHPRADILNNLLEIHKHKGDQQNFTMTDVQTEAYVGL